MYRKKTKKNNIKLFTFKNIFWQFEAIWCKIWSICRKKCVYLHFCSYIQRQLCDKLTFIALTLLNITELMVFLPQINIFIIPKCINWKKNFLILILMGPFPHNILNKQRLFFSLIKPGMSNSNYIAGRKSIKNCKVL